MVPEYTGTRQNDAGMDKNGTGTYRNDTGMTPEYTEMSLNETVINTNMAGST